LIERIQSTLGRQFEDKNIQLEISMESNLPNVMVDKDRIIQVLTNLVGNALQYTAEGGRVTIAARHTNNEVLVSVRDTGIGIPAEHLPHIFDRFYRADASRSRHAGGGSGIGLTIARALVEAHGGHIWVESAGEGAGSTFTFTLLIAAARQLD
ncbi:MAG TPA: ATP-binding protein, partial [Anaerolineales bacterium]|nr:ATP-binding protein [Anaerolineales bacterium]